jgi:hypothetical protein
LGSENSLVVMFGVGLVEGSQNLNENPFVFLIDFLNGKPLVEEQGGLGLLGKKIYVEIIEILSAVLAKRFKLKLTALKEGNKRKSLAKVCEIKLDKKLEASPQIMIAIDWRNKGYLDFADLL